MDAELFGWAVAGYLLVFATAFAIGMIHKSIIKIAESVQ